VTKAFPTVKLYASGMEASLAKVNSKSSLQQELDSNYFYWEAVASSSPLFHE